MRRGGQAALAAAGAAGGIAGLAWQVVAVEGESLDRAVVGIVAVVAERSLVGPVRAVAGVDVVGRQRESRLVEACWRIAKARAERGVEAVVVTDRATVSTIVAVAAFASSAPPRCP